MSGDAVARSRAQVQAADPKASVWVSASAGTGKTRVLTDRVVRLLLAGTEPGRILCLTFTNAAAAEMANRVNDELSAWASRPEPELIDRLRALTGETPDAERIALARRLFGRVLEAAVPLRIQTIHAFCQSLLARFPVEARVAPHFRLLDERSAAEVFRGARDDLLADIAAGRRADLADALAEVSVQVREDRFDELMAELAGARAVLRRSVARRGGLERTLRALRRCLDLADGEDEAAICAAAGADDAFDGAALRRVAAAMLLGSARDKTRGRIIADWLSDPDGRGTAIEHYLRGFFIEKGQGKVFDDLAYTATTQRQPDALDVLAREASRLEAVRERIRAARTYCASAALLRLGHALLQAFDAAKQRLAALDYDDLILKAAEMLSVSANAQWVLFKLDGGIDHVLIDEAQDTNPDQWDVVQRIAGEFFAGLGAREVERTIFAVGDPKQSIYSFQRANPVLFGQSRDFFESRVVSAGRLFRESTLLQSYRSVSAVLSVVDAAFADPIAADGVVFGGHAVRHEVFRAGAAGCVEVWPLEEPDEAEAADADAPPLERSTYVRPSTRLARRIADTIRLWLDRGERLDARGRLVRPGDVMILVQQRSGFVAEMVRALKERDVPVAGTDRMMLTEQIAVQDLIALGRFALLPQDDLMLACVLKSPYVGFGEDDLFALAHGRGARSLWRTLRERAGERLEFAAAHRKLAALLGRADYVRPYEFFAAALAGPDGRREFVRRLGAQANDPIDEFLALALHYERNRAPSLEGFLHWLEAGEVEVRRDLEFGRNEVRILTAHGAKGLQAPIVFLPDTVRVPSQQKDPGLLWVSAGGEPLLLWPPRAADQERQAADARADLRRRAAEEHHRLLYVAMTRAEDRLYVCGWRSRDAAKPECWYEIVRSAVARIGTPAILSDHRSGWRYATAQTAATDAGRAAPERPEPAAGAPDWLRRPAAPEPEPSRPLAPSRIAAEPAVLSPLADDGRRFRRGRLIHRLLQGLPSLPPAQRAAAAARFLSRQAGLDDALREEIGAEALGVLEAPAFADLFGSDSQAEVPIVGRIGRHVVAGQVDRLVVGLTVVRIVDYKSNRPAPASAAEVATAYLRQMAAYRAVLEKIYPEKSVECALLWTDVPRLMPLPPDLLRKFSVSEAS